jgi:branched-chain amino acid transport system ATP-binding protein
MLAVENLEVVYDGVLLVLKGISLTVPDRAVVALLGANGAGKTTTLRAVTGLLPLHRGEITKGRVLLDGRRIDRLDPRGIVRAGIGQVMEGRRIFAGLTVEENLRVGGFSAPKDLAGGLERVWALFPLLERGRRQVAGYLSGGEQQMLAIGRALMPNPRCLLLDKPSLGLAPIVVAQIRDLPLEDEGITARVIDEVMGHEASTRGAQHRGSAMVEPYRYTTPEMAARVVTAIQPD